MASSTMPVDSPVRVEDMMPVRSRVRWEPILAGSLVALSLYFLLTLLGAALGFTVENQASAKTMAIAAAVYAAVITALCLFVGGVVASQMSVGENKFEGALYGVLVWAVVSTMLLWLMATGVRAGFNAVVGVATAGATVGNAVADNTTQKDWEANAKAAGFSQAQIDDVKAKTKDAAGQAKAAVDDPATKEKADAMLKEANDKGALVAWLAFGGTLLGMLAAVLGGRFGAGPSFELFAVARMPVGRQRIHVELP